MRIIKWIAGTLLMRSWLIFGGVALGLIARFIWPVQIEDPQKTLIEAEQRFEELDDFEGQRSFLDRLGDTELTK